MPSESTIKREFARVDARGNYARKVGAATATEIVELPFARGELLLAAELETNGLAALTDEVVAMGELATIASEGQVPEKDVAHRDARGPQRTIRQLDVAQDMILTATKLTAAQLISFAMREYLPSMPMTATTLIRRVFTIHGRKETRPGDELIVFYKNPRDPAINDALQAASARLNSRALHRGDRALRFAVEPEPATDRRVG